MRSRSHREAKIGLAAWCTSIVLHLLVMLAFLSVLVPAGSHFVAPQELILGPPTSPGEELVVLQMPDDGGDADDGLASLQNLQIGGATELISHPSGEHAASGPVGFSTSGSRLGESGGQRASFFGTVASGNRFLFVVDVSSSMGRAGRLERALDELRESISQLGPDQEFCVLLFSDEMSVMFGWEQPAMLRASAKNRRKLFRWLATVESDGGTNPRRSLAAALTMQPSAVFMLSDGAFDEPKSESEFFGAEEPVISNLIEEYGEGQTPVHTVALADPESKANLEEISRLTGGTFRFVPREKKSRKKMNSERRAASWLRLAQQHETRGRLDLAEHYYRKIVGELPGTSAAEEVRRRDR